MISPVKLGRQLRMVVHIGLGPKGRKGVERLGHRKYVGDMWDEIGQMQYDFLVDKGLRPTDILLDIGCGALRGGVHFIRYLERGHYLGIDREQTLLQRGVSEELGDQLFHEKEPELIASSNFEFERFSLRPSYAFAQSLFTHLNKQDIERCFRNLRPVVDPGSRFFATFSETKTPDRMVRFGRSHPHAGFYYTKDEMTGFGSNDGWRSRYIGDWGHPRGQMVVEYMAI